MTIVPAPASETLRNYVRAGILVPLEKGHPAGGLYLLAAASPSLRGLITVWDGSTFYGREHLTREEALDRWPSIATEIRALRLPKPR